MKKEKTFISISEMIMLYLILCFVDVILHNVTTHAYAWWNIFSILFG